MAWTTIKSNEDDLDEAIADFESGVSSIDDFSVASHGHSQVVALVQYTA
jgi:hypothetical protein